MQSATRPCTLGEKVLLRQHLPQNGLAHCNCVHPSSRTWQRAQCRKNNSHRCCFKICCLRASPTLAALPPGIWSSRGAEGP